MPFGGSTGATAGQACELPRSKNYSFWHSILTPANARVFGDGGPLRRIGFWHTAAAEFWDLKLKIREMFFVGHFWTSIRLSKSDNLASVPPRMSLQHNLPQWDFRKT